MSKYKISEKGIISGIILSFFGGGAGAVAYYLWWSSKINASTFSYTNRQCHSIEVDALRHSSNSLLTYQQTPSTPTPGGSGQSPDRTSDPDSHISCGSGIIFPTYGQNSPGSIGQKTDIIAHRFKYSKDDIPDYLGTRYVSLFADLRLKEDPTDGSSKDSVMTGGGFILGPATDKTHEGKEAVYYLGTDLYTYSLLTSVEHNVTPFYGFKPFNQNGKDQEFWRLSIDDEWSYAAVGIPFASKDGFDSKKDDQLALGLGILVVDLEPHKTKSRSIGRQKSPSKDKLKQELLNKGNSDHIKKLTDSFDKYGDVTFGDEDNIDTGYMLDQEYDPQSVSTPDPSQSPDPSTTGTNQNNKPKFKVREIDKPVSKRRDFDENDKITVKTRDPRDFKKIISKDYWFPVYDWQVGQASDGLGSPLVSWHEDNHNPKSQIRFGGVVTKKHDGTNLGLVSQIMHKGDYDPITKSAQQGQGNTLCDKITETSSPDTWLRGIGADQIKLRVPSFCNSDNIKI